MLTIQISVFIGILIILLGPLLWVLSARWLSTSDISERLEDFTGIQSSTTGRMSSDEYARRIGLTGSFSQRTIIPMIRSIGRFFGRFTPVRVLEEQEHQLILAGQPMGLGAREFYGLRFISILVGVGLAFVLLRVGRETLHFAGAFLSVFACTLLPIVWLRRLIRERQKEISRGLPDALDMLSVCATAGLGFDQSIQRVSEFWETSMGNEFNRVIAEMEMGVSRSQALRNLAYRTEVRELSSFVSIIVQAEQLGMSISNTINGIAEQMRIERRFKAQEEARKLPTKILFPLAFFIFPAMIAVILGPSLPALVDLFQFIGN
jgi:tight adherence protein C